MTAAQQDGHRRGRHRGQQLRQQRLDLQAQERQVDVLNERARIAREIHDVLAHSLGALGI